MMKRAAATLLALAAWSSVASAQDAMERAREAFDRAEFGAAIEAYDEAAAGEGLSREELIELLRGRALAKHAALDVAGAERDLVALLSLEPEAELTDMAPPALQRAFARLRGEVRAPLTIEVEAARIEDGFRVRTAVREDVASLVREVRVSWRARDEWAFARGEDVPIVAGGRLEYAVEAIGPGGAVLAREGSRDAPRTIEAPAIVEAAPGSPPGAGDELAIGLSAAAVAVLAAVAIVLAVVLAPSGVQLTAPMEMR